MSGAVPILTPNNNDGVFYNNGKDKQYTGYSGGDSITRSSDGRLRFDASRYNGLYGDSTTIQPAAFQLLMIIKI